MCYGEIMKPEQDKQPRRKTAIFSIILSIMALTVAGISKLLTREPIVAGQGAEAAVNKAVGTATISVLNMPIVVLSFFLAFLAIFFAVLRLRKAPIGSILALVLSGWALSIAVGVFKHIANK